MDPTSFSYHSGRYFLRSPPIKRPQLLKMLKMVNLSATSVSKLSRALNHHGVITQSARALVGIPQKVPSARDEKKVSQQLLRRTLNGSLQKALKDRNADHVKIALSDMRDAQAQARPGDVTLTKRLLQHQIQKGGQIDTCSEIFQLLVSIQAGLDIKDFNGMIKVVAGTGHVEDACAVLDLMPKAGLRPDDETFNHLFDGILLSSDRADWSPGAARDSSRVCLSLLHQVQQAGLKPCMVRCVSIMKSLRKGGNLEGCKALIALLRESSVKPDPKIFTLFMTGLVKEGKYEDILQALDQMRESGVKPTWPDFSKLFAKLLKKQQVTLCMEVVAQLRRAGVKPDMDAFQNLFNKLLETGQKDKCEAAVRLMLDCGSRPTPSMFNTLMKVKVVEKEFDQCRSLLGQMEDVGIHPDVTTFTILVIGLKKAGKAEEADDVSRLMAELGVERDSEITEDILKHWSSH